MKTVNRYIFTIVVLCAATVLSASDSLALVNMSLTETDGHGELERNSSYSIDCKISPDQDTDISQVYAYIKYRKAIFTDVTVTDRMEDICSIEWETDYVNATFEDDGTWITVQYLKANTEGPDWEAGGQEYLVYTLNFKIKPDAPLESTNVNFTQSATISDEGGGNITGTIDNYSFTVVLDSTAPVTSAEPAGGYYNTDQDVALSINEEGTVYYKVDTGEYAEYAEVISLTGTEETLTAHDLFFYGVDDPVGKSPNQEPANLETYYIDKEDPGISNIEADPTMVGLGGEVDITFEVSDLSGVLGNGGQPDYVRLGGRGASWIEGTDAGSFTYRITINGGESDGDIVIGVTDRAGNFTVQTAADAVSYDLEGPEFTIEADPDPVSLEQLMTLTITASEELQESWPTVTVGGAGADYDHHSGLEYIFNYYMTARGWEADFACLSLNGDTDGDGMPNWWEIQYGLDPEDAGSIDTNNGAVGDPDGDGWVNLAEYRFYQESGRLVDPNNYAEGGQVIPLHIGWNLVGYTVNTSWYKENTPSGLIEGVSKERLSDDNWGNLFNSYRFKDSVANFVSTMACHPGGEWTYYGQFQPDWRNSLDYESPDEGVWVNMIQEDKLILEGPRVSCTTTYPEISLGSGWNLVNILPRTMFYVEGYSHDPETPTDQVGSSGYSSVPEMLKAALNINDTDFEKIDCIQIMYSAPYGMQAYDKSLPWFFWSLKFVSPGYGMWIKLADGETIELKYQEPDI